MDPISNNPISKTKWNPPEFTYEKRKEVARKIKDLLSANGHRDTTPVALAGLSSIMLVLPEERIGEIPGIKNILKANGAVEQNDSPGLIMDGVKVIIEKAIYHRPL